MYPVGSNTILYNVETKIQKFISSSSKSEEITCYTMSNNHKYFAIAERSEKPVATIFDMYSFRRKKVITLPDTETKVRIINTIILIIAKYKVNSTI